MPGVFRGVFAVDTSCDAVLAASACYGPRDSVDFLAIAAQPPAYKKSIRPACGNSTHKGPTLVEVQFKLMNVNGVDEKLGHVTLNGYLRTLWKDPRLAFNSIASGGCFDTIDLSGDEGEDWIWIPDLYVDNLVQMTAGSAKVTQISPDGSVFRSVQVLVTIKADFDLSRLPYDEHEVRLIVASYSQPTTNLRMMPLGGKVGEGASGVGLIAANVRHKVWDFVGSSALDAYTTPGRVRTPDDAWDYVDIFVYFKRKPKYFLDHAVYPAAVFASISYSQFWVDANSAPARATLAVIPVLIMRTMFSSVYSSLPQGSQRMWLSDFMFTINLMVALGAVEFALIQHLCQVEKRRAARLQNLSSARSTAERLFAEADTQGMPVLDFLNSRYARHSRSTVGDMKATLSEGPRSSNFDVKEVDFAFIKLAKDVFSHRSRTEENLINASELRKSLRTFNIYISRPHAAHAMGMFLRDIGQETPMDDAQITFSFAHFTKLLLVIDKYSLACASARRKACTGAGIVYMFQSVSPSRTVDILARIVFPIAYIFVTIFYYAFLGTWKLDPVTYDP